jgi:hypothetical protein
MVDQNGTSNGTEPGPVTLNRADEVASVSGGRGHEHNNLQIADSNHSS